MFHGCGFFNPSLLLDPAVNVATFRSGALKTPLHRTMERKCRSPVSRILSPSCEDGRSFLSPRRGGAPRLRGVRLLPGDKRTGSPSPVLSCTTRGLPCRFGCPKRGGLLPHHFILTCALAGHRRYASCCTFRPGSSRFPSPTFVRRVALWCPDFPQPPLARKLRPSGERRREGARSLRGFQGKDRGLSAHAYPRNTSDIPVAGSRNI